MPVMHQAKQKLAHASRDCKQAATGIANIQKQSDGAKEQLDKTNAQLQELQSSLDNIGASPRVTMFAMCSMPMHRVPLPVSSQSPYDSVTIDLWDKCWYECSCWVTLGWEICSV
jgi:hypothetical protein